MLPNDGEAASHIIADRDRTAAFKLTNFSAPLTTIAAAAMAAAQVMSIQVAAVAVGRVLRAGYIRRNTSRRRRRLGKRVGYMVSHNGGNT